MTPPTPPTFAEGLEAYVEGDWERAAALLEEAVADSPDHPRALEFLGLARMRQGDLDSAVELLARAEACAGTGEVAFSRGTVEREAGRPESALAAFTRAEEAGHDPLRARVARASCLSLLGRGRAARDLLEEVLEASPGDPEALFWVAHAAAGERDQAGMRDRATAALRELLDGDGAVDASLRARAHFLLASLLDDQEELFEEAAAHYRAGLDLDPGFAVGHNNLGAVYLRLGRVLDARRHLLRALELEPGYHQVHRNLARVYYAEAGEEGLRADVLELVGVLAPEELGEAMVGLMMSLADESRREAYQDSYARAHRLKNLLAVAGGRLRRLLRKAADAPRIVGELETLREQQEATYARLAEDLRLLKPASEEASVVDLGAVCRAVVGASRRGLDPASGVRVEAHVSPDLPVLQGDREGLREVLNDLVRNAVEALEGGGVVRVEAERSADGRAVELRVVDDGPGVPEAAREELFRPGFTTKAQGSGLGLALVRRTIHELRGRIELRSPPSGGACFAILLPVDAPAVRDGRLGLSARPVRLEDAHALNVDELA